MLKTLSFLIFLGLWSGALSAQNNPQVTVIEFVEILDEHRAEAFYYYENNWKLLRVKAQARGFIDSFQLVEIPFSPELPAHLMLITNFKNQENFEAGESNFKEVLAEHGEMRLLNEIKPAAFRKNLFHKISIRNY
ncbi:MAG: hypothetical protein AAFU64_11905 [Bacteroidota bacterium]